MLMVASAALFSPPPPPMFTYCELAPLKARALFALLLRSVVAVGPLIKLPLVPTVAVPSPSSGQ